MCNKTPLTLCALTLALSTVAQSGTLDPTFGDMGTLLIEREDSRDLPGALAIQADGKIIASATHEYALDPDWEFVEQEHEVWRFLEDGSTDPEFGTNGRVVLPPDLRVGRPDAVHVDELGRIILAGSCRGEPGDLGDLFVARLLPSGELDQTFNGVGVANATNIQNRWDVFADMGIGPDGSIYLGGRTRPTGQSNSFMVKFSSDGVLDAGFGMNGMVEWSFGPSGDEIIGLRVLATGKVLVSGRFTVPASEVGLFSARFEANGGLDYTYGENMGVTRITHPSQGVVVNSMDVDAEGRSVIAGYFSITPQDIEAVERAFVYRMTADGSADQSFGSEGMVEVLFPAADRCRGMDIQADPDGSLYVAATTTYTSGFGVAHLFENGDFDASFGSPAPSHITSTSPADEARSILARQPDGRVVVLGATSGQTALAHDLVLFRMEASLTNAIADVDGDSTLSVVYPSPVTTTSVIRLSPAHRGRVRMTMVDAQGRHVDIGSLGVHIDPGTQEIPVGGLHELSSGPYTILLESESLREALRVLMLSTYR